MPTTETPNRRRFLRNVMLAAAGVAIAGRRLFAGEAAAAPGIPATIDGYGCLVRGVSLIPGDRLHAIGPDPAVVAGEVSPYAVGPAEAEWTPARIPGLVEWVRHVVPPGLRATGQAYISHIHDGLWTEPDVARVWTPEMLDAVSTGPVAPWLGDRFIRSVFAFPTTAPSKYPGYTWRRQAFGAPLARDGSIVEPLDASRPVQLEHLSYNRRLSVAEGSRVVRYLREANLNPQHADDGYHGVEVVTLRLTGREAS